MQLKERATLKFLWVREKIGLQRRNGRPQLLNLALETNAVTNLTRNLLVKVDRQRHCIMKVYKYHFL